MADADVENTVQNDSTSESDDKALQATGKVGKDSKTSCDMPSLSPGKTETSNTEHGLTNGATISKSSDPSSTDPTLVSKCLQLNEEQTVKNGSPKQSTNNVSSLGPLEPTDRPTPTAPVETCVQVGALNGESVPQSTNPNVSFSESLRDDGGVRRWRNTYQNGRSYRRARRVPKSWCPYAVLKNKYTLSCMLLYIVMTHFFARLYFLNKVACSLSTCSVYNELLVLHGFNLLTFSLSLAMQVIMDICNVHTKNSCIFNIVMIALHTVLLLLIFGHINYCQGSRLDYVFPTLTLFMCNGYTILEILTLIKLVS